MSNHSYDDTVYQQGRQRIAQDSQSLSMSRHSASRSENVPLAAMSSSVRSAASASIPPPSILVNDHDVLSGRGVNIAQHPGNERFRTLVTSYTDRAYCTSYSVTEKKAVAMQIIQHIRGLEPPGRFLKREGRGSVSRGLGGPWIELSERECIKKTCQALRDCNRQDRSGYAGGVAAPPDVKMVVEQASKAGLTAKDRAVAAAKTVGFSPKNSERSVSSMGRSDSSSTGSGSKRTRDEVDNDYYTSLRQPSSGSNTDLLALQINPPARAHPSSASPHRTADQQYYATTTGMGTNTNIPPAQANSYPEYYRQHIPQPNYFQRYGYNNHSASNNVYPAAPRNPSYPGTESVTYQTQGVDSHGHMYPVSTNFHHVGMVDHSLHHSPSGIPYSYGSSNQPIFPESLNPFHSDDQWALKKQRTDDTDPSTGTSASSPSNALDSSMDIFHGSHTISSSQIRRDHDTDQALFSIRESHDGDEDKDSWTHGPADQLNQDDSLGQFGAGIFD